MSFIGKLKDLVGIDDEYEEEEEIEEQELERETRRSTTREQVQPRKFGLDEEIVTLRKERENVIAMPNNPVKELTTRFKIVVIDPKSFDECPKLVDSLKSRKPVIINLENIENDTARKIFDFLSGATYALNGNVQKIAQNIFVFLPENVDVQAGSDSQSLKYGDDKENPWS